MIKIISVLFVFSLMSACASSPTQSEPIQKYSTDQISTEMQFQRVVHRLVKNLYAGNSKEILSNYAPLKKEHIVASRMASKRHKEILLHKETAIKTGLKNALQELFLEQDLTIVNIDHDLQSVTLRSNITAVYPFLWRFEFELEDSEYYLENVEDLTSDISITTLFDDSFDYIMQKAKSVKSLKSEDKKTFFFTQVTRDLEQKTYNTKLLTPEVVFGAFNFSVAQNALTAGQAKTMAAYINEHKVDSLNGFQLQIDIYFENESSALEQVEALAPRLSNLDPTGLALARAIHLMKNHRLPEAAAAARMAMDKETLNPWPYVFTRRIAKDTSNKPLLEVVNQAIKANFNDNLKAFDETL